MISEKKVDHIGGTGPHPWEVVNQIGRPSTQPPFQKQLSRSHPTHDATHVPASPPPRTGSHLGMRTEAKAPKREKAFEGEKASREEASGEEASREKASS